MAHKPGGNVDAIKAAVQQGAEALKQAGDKAETLKPAAMEAANKVVATLKNTKSKLDLGDIKGKLTKENGVMAGGAVLAADGVRRAFKKDENGKRHVVRGAIQTAVGVGAFSAALITKRNGQSADEGPKL